MSSSFEIHQLPFENKINASLYLMYYNDFDPETLAKRQLNREELKRFSNFKSLKRKREFIATRKLKNQVLGGEDVFYSDDGRPMTANYKNLSFSHSNSACGLVYADHPVGLDLEPIDEKIQRVKNKFLSSRECDFFDTSDTETLIRIWSAKEALYKLAPQRGLIFSENLIVNPSNKLMKDSTDIELMGYIKINGKSICYSLLSKKINNFILTINTDLGNETAQ